MFCLGISKGSIRGDGKLHQGLGGVKQVAALPRVRRARVLTIVVPLRLTPSRRGVGLRRLARLMAALPPEFGAVVVDDSQAAADRDIAAAAVAVHRRARHLPHLATAQAPFSIGPLRDAGVAAAPDGMILLHDVDFFAPPEVYRRLAGHLRQTGLAEAPGAFACVPVAFLSSAGSQLARLKPQALWPLLPRPLGRALGLVERVTLGSSAILMHRRTALATPHDPAFTGHGAEDFDLLHRLSLGFPRGERPADYRTDYGSRQAERGGFRAYFGRYGRPLLDAGLLLAHAWHPRRVDAAYYASRQRNFERLAARFDDAAGKDDDRPALTLR